MNKIISSNKVYIGKSEIPNAGRGVFAKVDIEKGEVIEKCPVIEIPEHDASNLRGSILVTYIYYLGKNKNRLTLALGFGSIYNHTDKPNAVYKEERGTRTIDFVAIRKIKKDEEITVHYSPGDQKDKSPLWFTK